MIFQDFIDLVNSIKLFCLQGKMEKGSLFRVARVKGLTFPSLLEQATKPTTGTIAPPVQRTYHDLPRLVLKMSHVMDCFFNRSYITRMEVSRELPLLMLE